MIGVLAQSFNQPTLDYHALAPEIILGSVVVLVLLVDLFVDEQRKWMISSISGIGVRYPAPALRALSEAGLEYAGWLPNHRVPTAFAQARVTVPAELRNRTSAAPLSRVAQTIVAPPADAFWMYGPRTSVTDGAGADTDDGRMVVSFFSAPGEVKR